MSKKLVKKYSYTTASGKLVKVKPYERECKNQFSKKKKK